MTDETAMERIRMTSEALNKNFSASCDKESLLRTLDAALMRLFATYKGREWPMPALFVDAMQANQAKAGSVVMSEEVDTGAINAKRIRGGEAVGEYWIDGRGAVHLIRAYGITDNMLEGYRRSIFQREVDVVGLETAEKRKALRDLRYRNAIADMDAEEKGG